MISEISQILLVMFRTVSQILTAAITITAFSLWLFLLTLNIKDKVIKAFSLILISIAIIYGAEALGSTTPSQTQAGFWLQFQWIGIIFLPAAFFHFSDALLATTGKPSRGRRKWAVRGIYGISLFFLFLLITNRLVGSLAIDREPVVQLLPTTATHIFSGFYLFVMILTWYNFFRAFNRTTTATSRRRIGYILVGGLIPAFGSFPFLLFGSDIAAQHSLLFWIVVAFVNFFQGAFTIITAYAVSFFGISWPDRVLKSRLSEWIIRGPLIASLALGISTIVRRLVDGWGAGYLFLVPISTVVTIVLGQYFVTVFRPLWEQWFIHYNMREELDVLKRLENSLITRQDLRQFIEMVLAAVCDRLQSAGAYVVSLNEVEMELVVQVGQTNFEELKSSENIKELILANGYPDGFFSWDENILVPLMYQQEEDQKNLLGLLVVCEVSAKSLDDEQRESLLLLSNRVVMALRDRYIQKKIFIAVEELTPQIDLIQKMRAAGPYDDSTLLSDNLSMEHNDLIQVVKDALSHYWGGPKLTGSPLINLKVVQNAIKAHEGNGANALRSILREGIEKIRPEGDRHFTGEWILYNILEMKFMQGRKVRDIALRLAMSEADLYRKQKVAIENVANAIMEMEDKVNETTK